MAAFGLEGGDGDAGGGVGGEGRLQSVDDGGVQHGMIGGAQEPVVIGGGRPVGFDPFEAGLRGVAHLGRGGFEREDGGAGFLGAVGQLGDVGTEHNEDLLNRGGTEGLNDPFENSAIANGKGQLRPAHPPAEAGGGDQGEGQWSVVGGQWSEW